MFKSIQACRGAAAILVVLHHLGSAVASPTYFRLPLFAVPFVSGDSGVEFFFVLSGFIITWTHFNDFGKTGALPRYLRKRALRIYPIYWLVFAMVYTLALTLRATVPHDFATLLKALALVPQNHDGVGNAAPVLSVAWTLEYEICFYALIGVFIASRHFGSLVFAALLVNFASCKFNGCTFPQSFISDNLMLLFGLGVLIAYSCKRPNRIKHPTTVAAICAMTFISFGAFEATMGTHALLVDRRLLFGLLSAVLIFSLVQAEDTGQLRITNRWMLLLGDSSYSLYLIHYPLISVLCKILTGLGLKGYIGAAIAYPLILCICIAAGIALHLSVERPIQHAFSSQRHQRSAINVRGL